MAGFPADDVAGLIAKAPSPLAAPMAAAVAVGAHPAAEAAPGEHRGAGLDLGRRLADGGRRIDAVGPDAGEAGGVVVVDPPAVAGVVAAVPVHAVEARAAPAAIHHPADHEA